MSEHPTPEAQPTSEAAASPDTAVAVAEPPVAEPPVAEPPVAEVPAPVAAHPAKATRTVQVPVWVLAVVAALVLAAGAFFVGRATAPESDSGPGTLAEAVEMTASGDMEVGDFDARALLQALSQNEDLDLGLLGDLILGGGRN